MQRLIPIVLLLAAVSASAQTPSADLSISSVESEGLSYSFDWRNLGLFPAENVAITVDIPPNTILKRIYIDHTTCDYSQLPLRCTSGTIAAAGARLLHFALDLTASESGTYAVRVEITSDTPDPNPADNSVTITSNYTKAVDLAARIVPRRGRADVGEALTYESDVVNSIGDITAVPVTIRYSTAPDVAIERVEPQDSRWSCSIENASSATCTAPSLDTTCGCSNPILVTVRAGSALSWSSALAMAVSSDLPDTHELDNTGGASLETYEHIDVTTIADSGVGSLRQAIETANRTINVPIKIAFRIPGPVPPEGWFTIVPETPLPSITVDNMFVDGATQTAFTGDTNPRGPEIAIDGHLAHRGLVIQSGCEARVEGLAIGNFDENQAIWFTGGEHCYLTDFYREGVFIRRVANNYIGVDPTATRAWPNLRGIRADDVIGEIRDNLISSNTRSGIWMWEGTVEVTHNRIESNGASGILVGPHAEAHIRDNTISFHPQMGVAIVPGSFDVELRRNSMIDDGGLGIDWGLNGHASQTGPQPQSPVLLSATFDAAENRTTIRGTAGPGETIEVFANRSPDGDGEQFLGSTIAPSMSFELTVSGDYTGRWLNATATRESTSEVSNAVRVR
jgi:hypothetical protein